MKLFFNPAYSDREYKVKCSLFPQYFTLECVVKLLTRTSLNFETFSRIKHWNSVSRVIFRSERVRAENEMIPIKVERSDWTSPEYPPENSVDLDYSTRAMSKSDATGANWFKLSFDKVQCVEEILWRGDADIYWVKWTCNNQDCSECDGGDCKFLGVPGTAEVSTESITSNRVDIISNCRYGDTVMIRHEHEKSSFQVTEFVVTPR